MLAVDTNLIVRYLTGDHPEQSAKAKALIDGADVFVGTTVLLETEWVLRGVYGLPAARVVDALRAFAGLPRVTVEAPTQTAAALDQATQGMDFADALHLAMADHCEAFITFDRRFAALAKRLGTIDVRVP